MVGEVKKITLLLLLGTAAGILLSQSPLFGQVLLETEDLRLEIAADGHLQSLKSKATGAEYAWTNAPTAIASVYRGGQMAVASQEDYAEFELPSYRGGERFAATGVSLAGDRLTIRFDQAKVTAACRVTRNPHYLAFELQSLEGDPIDRIDLMQLRLKRLPLQGPWINVACDEQFGVCLCAGKIRTDAGMDQRPDYVELRALATKQVGLQGATAVLFGCPQPQRTFLETMEIVERDFQLPPGAKNRRAPVQQYSYLWCTPTPANVDRYIALAKRAGFRMLLFSYSAFARGAGHFEFNSSYPRGIADLRQVTDRIRAAGLKVGLHLHYSKSDRTDAYVTPVPDDRLHQVRTFTLASAIDDRVDTISVQENPAGCTRANERRILKIGNELVAYRDYTVQPPYQFTGCERGHLRTTASGRRAGDMAGLLDVDDWTRFIRFDQNTDIQDEAARRIAQIANATGPYDLVYFDGAEDVHDPFWFHVANAQYRVYHLLQPPPVCEAAMSSHFNWHFATRGCAYDVNGKHIKNYCHEISCRTAAVRSRDFTPIDFGWIFQFYPDLGPDVLEYVLSRAAGWDCPFSLRLGLDEVAANPRAEDCFDVIKTWEDARIGGKITDAQRAELRTLDPNEYRYVKVWDAMYRKEWIDTYSKESFNDQEHHLLINEQGAYELVAIREIPGVAGGRVKAYVFRRPAYPDRTYVLLWAIRGDTTLTLAASAKDSTLMRPFGTPLPIKPNDSGGVVIPVGGRCYLCLAGRDAEMAAAILQAAR